MLRLRKLEPPTEEERKKTGHPEGVDSTEGWAKTATVKAYSRESALREALALAPALKGESVLVIPARYMKAIKVKVVEREPEITFEGL